MENLILLDSGELYQLFGVGLILGFSLTMISLLLSGFIHLFKGLTKESIK